MDGRAIAHTLLCCRARKMYELSRVMIQPCCKLIIFSSRMKHVQICGSDSWGKVSEFCPCFLQACAII